MFLSTWYFVEQHSYTLLDGKHNNNVYLVPGSTYVMQYIPRTTRYHSVPKHKHTLILLFNRNCAYITRQGGPKDLHVVGTTEGTWTMCAWGWYVQFLVDCNGWKCNSIYSSSARLIIILATYILSSLTSPLETRFLL